jgi:hypothetical protein
LCIAISPEGMAENSPGRQSWVYLDRTRMLTGGQEHRVTPISC